MDLLPACVIGLLLVLGTPSTAVAQTVLLTSSPTGTVFCNGSEVIFTCETRGSNLLEWRGDSFYVGNPIILSQNRLPNFSLNSSSNDNTVATLTQNTVNNNVRVLESTIRIAALSNAPSGFVMCVREDGTGERIDFQVLAPPAVPDVLTFQLEHLRNMCAIASVLRSPTNPAEADVTTYAVLVDGAPVPYTSAEFISTGGTRHSTLVYNATCGAHRISVSANSMCGPSLGNNEITLNPNDRFMPFDSATNFEGSIMVVTVGVVMVAVTYLLDLS